MTKLKLGGLLTEGISPQVVNTAIDTMEDWLKNDEWQDDIRDMVDERMPAEMARYIAHHMDTAAFRRSVQVPPSVDLTTAIVKQLIKQG